MTARFWYFLIFFTNMLQNTYLMVVPENNAAHVSLWFISKTGHEHNSAHTEQLSLESEDRCSKTSTNWESENSRTFAAKAPLQKPLSTHLLLLNQAEICGCDSTRRFDTLFKIYFTQWSLTWPVWWQENHLWWRGIHFWIERWKTKWKFIWKWSFNFR